ncbi:MAG: hypothetical protein Q8N54_08740 [Sulfurimicrobium sp.]|nr:hypothetical protein [Thiobacillus sp.]MDP2253870.1 hypothetical protein [Thiobacillus sp.]MDP2962834.1 hypothetical protein [Sulfurimicrobium sp.]
MLTLNVPDANPAPQQPVETRPKSVAEWLDRLPFGSPADTARQLVTALYALNRHALGADEHHALLALYRPVVARVAASLESQFADSGVPPHAQQRQVGDLLRELQTELGVGYKQVLLAMANRRFGRASPKRTAEVSARLLTALRDIQTACYLTYTPLPAGLWQEMHQIHAFAQASNLADNAVDGAISPSLAYSQALLIALADPPHMSHAELLHTRLYLDQFAALAMLTSAPVASHCGFPIQADGDAPPSHFAASQPHDGLWLDTDALCRHLHETVLRLRNGETPHRTGLPTGMEDELSLTLCKRLLKQWSTGAQRAFKRYATPDSTVQVVAGVSAIHRMLEMVPQAAQLQQDEADSLSIHGVEPVFAAPSAVNATRWTVGNDSASGLALYGTPNAPLNLKVGDPLALRADDAAAWSLGVIRWIRMADAQQVELGVERLSPQVQPVWVRLLRGHRKTNPEAALFIPGLPALKQNDRLLLPRHLYEIGMDADVWHPPHQYTLTFGRCLEHTPSFDLIAFTVFADEQP